MKSYGGNRGRGPAHIYIAHKKTCERVWNYGGNRIWAFSPTPITGIVQDVVRMPVLRMTDEHTGVAFYVDRHIEESFR